MKFKLSWVNNNTVPTSVSIFRFDNPPTNTDYGPPIATLVNGETEYIDDLVQGRTYYYLFETFTEKARNFSGLVTVTAEHRRGPGTSELKIGTETLGWCGTLTQTEILSPQALIDACGLVGIGIPFALNNDFRWHKFVRNGKVCFVPNFPLINRISWEQLYDRGLVFGVEGPGPVYPGSGTDQNKIITIGRDRYIVRLPTGADDRDNPNRTIPVFDGSIGELPGLYSEYADIVAPAIGAPVDNGRFPGVNPMFQNFTYRSTYHRVLCQEYDPDLELTLGRGAGNEVETNYHLMNTAGKTVITNNSWQPILELVED